MQGKQITLEDIQKDRILHTSIVEKCDLITRFYLENDELRKQLESLRKDEKDNKNKKK